MGFLNKYNKTQGYTYFYSLKIGNTIYNVGTGANDDSIITKINSDGIAVWEKSYSFEEKISFRKLISCSNNTDFLVLGTSSERSLFLLRINSQGDILWKKQIRNAIDYQMPTSKDFNTLVEISNENYVVGFTESEASRDSFTILLKFNGNGTILERKKLTFPRGRFKLKGITHNTNIIGLYGHFVIENLQENRGLIIELDTNLDAVTNIIQSSTLSLINDLIYKDRSYFVRGNTTDRQEFFVEFNLIKGNVSIQKAKLYKGPGINNLKYNSTHLYTESYGRSNAIISKIDYSFTPIWTKKFDFVNVHPALGILCQVTEQDIVLNNGLGSLTDSQQHAVIGSLDLELNSCRTTNDSTVGLENRKCAFSVVRMDYLLTNLDYSFVTIPDPVIASVLSKIDFLCPELGNPCIKEEKFCGQYDELLRSFTKCIEVSSNIHAEDAAAFKSCYKQFTDIFNEIDQNFMELQLGEYLRFQIDAIKEYSLYDKAEEDIKYREEASGAVQFILEYLSQLGNCTCEEGGPDLTEYALIQSGHLYLQSAGSMGEDSTKGIHLRWALRDSLSEHLPKANYATTTHNFNKSDDFVKIYRAKYVPYRVTLDFNNAPLQVNESSSQKNWVYQVSGKVFHVHFRSNSRYDQVRASIDPLVSPLDFIRNYGNAILEIENKTELSFKIAPKFEILDNGSSVKTELLSVPENKITSPKGASLRKTYVTEELNEKPLLSENIRSIRFSSNNAHVSLVSFEFYSDFISNTKKQNG